jgi:CHASE2 domain-containing sensor protein
MKRNLGLTAAFRHAKWLAALGLTLAALVLSLVLDLSGAIQPYRLKTLDALFRRVPLPAASPQVVVVTVDQPDLDFFKIRGLPGLPQGLRLSSPIAGGPGPRR